MPYDGFFLEFDDARSGDFSPLRDVPRNVRVVLGLVTTKVGTLEKKDDLKRRLDEASKHTSVDQLCVSAQCGFPSTIEGKQISAGSSGQTCSSRPKRIIFASLAPP